MALAHQSRIQKKIMIVFIGTVLRHQRRNSAATALQTEIYYNNHNATSARILCKQPLDSSTCACLLHECANKKAVVEGKLVHAHIIQTGFECHDIFLHNTLVNMYAKCGLLLDARRVLEQLPEQDVVSWTAIIAACYSHGHLEEALVFFRQMQLAGIQANQATFASVLRVCASLEYVNQGEAIHEEIIRRGFQSDIIVVNALVDMYAKCGVVNIARDLFDKMPQRNVVSWTTVIVGYAQNGCEEQAIQLFEQMQLTDAKPNAKTFASVLSTCANLGALERGMEIHREAMRSGFQSDVSVGNSLIDMYAKCGSIDDARALFNEICERNVISWTTMIAGYVKNGYFDEALNLFQEMPERNVVSWTAMITGCAQNGYIDEALELFQDMPKRNVVSWNAMLAGYAQNGYGEEALRFFFSNATGRCEAKFKNICECPQSMFRSGRSGARYGDPWKDSEKWISI